MTKQLPKLYFRQTGGIKQSKYEASSILFVSLQATNSYVETRGEAIT